MQRQALSLAPPAPVVAPATLAHDSAGGLPLPGELRAFFEPRFGQDFGVVRVHTGADAAHSAAAVDAVAYTTGERIVFGAGAFEPATDAGRRLIAHELAHVVQQSRGGAPAIQRTPARQVSCANRTPLRVPGAPFDIDDPVGVITAAENRANEWLDTAIDELTSTRNRILAGSGVGWPTVSDATAWALRLLAVDPDSDAAWRGNGPSTVGLVIRRLSAIRGTIGDGSFFFTCLGPATGTIGSCSGTICGGGGAFAATCPGSFRIVLCAPFWLEEPDWQARTLLHESAHNFAAFIRHSGRAGNAECYVRCAQVIAGADPRFQRPGLCPDP